MARKKKTTKTNYFADQLIDRAVRKKTLPVWLVQADKFEDDLSDLDQIQSNWLNSIGWTAKAGSYALLPDNAGKLMGAVFGSHSANEATYDPLEIGALPRILPSGNYHLVGDLKDKELAVIAWLLGAYHFDRYKREKQTEQKALKPPSDVDIETASVIAESVCLGRDLINTPANDLGPAELEAAARSLAKMHSARVTAITGDDLLKKNFPMIHAVGRASDRPPRLIDLKWGKAGPKVTLVGKGICFDTGGLNIKPGNAMELMKKDMGGAAAALSLGKMIMALKLPVRLRILIPAADNNISGNAFRPSDVLSSRNGMTVDIGNTDAEGRLVLADALSLADEDTPDYLINFATLTGAARVALGPELPPFYTDDEQMAGKLIEAGHRVGDPLWRMPFWAPYDKLLSGKVGDVSHMSNGGFAGSITAALFLKRFVKKAEHFVHFDIYGWVPCTNGARLMGGEPQAARAVFEFFRRVLP